MTKGDSTAEFGREIRRRRMAHGWTLEDLSERSQLTPNYIGGIEMGKRDPSLSTVLALARGLDVPPSELLGPVQHLSPAAEEMGRLFDTAAHEIQTAVLALLRAIVKKLRK